MNFFKPIIPLFLACGLAACASNPNNGSLSTTAGVAAPYKGDTTLVGSGVTDHFAARNDWRRSALNNAFQRQENTNPQSFSLKMPDGSGRQITWGDAVSWVKGTSDPLEQMNRVNTLINTNYRYNSSHPKGDDYIYTPGEVMNGQGKPLCRDYAFAKLAMLKDAGWPDNYLYYTSLKNSPTDSEYHAVAVVRIPGQPYDYALDLRTDTDVIKLDPSTNTYDPLGVKRRPIDAITPVSVVSRRPQRFTATPRPWIFSRT